jgi:XTP/dITP diphosphohydrolase
VTRRRLLIATHSRHKLEELRTLLELPDADLVGLGELGITADAPEPFESFAENACAKARFYADLSGLPTMADDSGLEVDALGGGPGVRTRRYAGEVATDEENNARLLDALRGLRADRRRARYRCLLAYAEPGWPEAAAVLRDGTMEGRIAESGRGAGGFGYDPIFEPLSEPVGGRTVGQMSAEEKNRISHRAEAARKMGAELRARGY